MIDREKVIKGLEAFNKNRICLPHLIPWDEITDAIALLKEQEAKKFLVDETGKITPLPVVVRCKDCKYCEYPKSEKEWCKKGHLHGKAETWFCADGNARKVGEM